METTTDSIDAYWRAANYLTVAHMYLKDNFFLQRGLENDDMLPHPNGHWGTCPGVNFVYAHINRYIQKHKRKVQLIVGPGHAGNALMANLRLESLSCNCDEYQQTVIRTETNPFIPGTIYDGGELGYSLPVAFGAALDSPGRLCICLIGDGEAETGGIASSWLCKEFLSCASGFVLPILHLNGYKMGNRSLFSYKNDEEIGQYFFSLGYYPLFVNASHSEMIAALDTAETIYNEIEHGKERNWPVIILKTPKGWTAPNYKTIQIEGSLMSHKNPLQQLKANEAKEYLLYWLKSYHPEELFDVSGHPTKRVLKGIPDSEGCLGLVLNQYTRVHLLLPDLEQHCIPGTTKEYRNIKILESYFKQLSILNPNTFRIMSPDELQSNLLGSLKEPLAVATERVLEILNENICQAWMQGYTLTGRNCVMIGYEAFMPIITSMVSQFSKWIYQANMVSWREKKPSINYILTSLCWSNTYSHQNPEFISALLNQGHDFVRIYFPPDANTLLVCTECCLLSANMINVIIASKQAMPQWLDIHKARAAMRDGLVYFDFFSGTQPDVIIAAAGDYPVRECRKAIDMLIKYGVTAKIRFVAVIELTVIGSQATYVHALSTEEFKDIFDVVPVVFSFHGYPNAIKMLLYDRINSDRLKILGYTNKSIYSENDLEKMIINNNSRYDIAIEAITFLFKTGKICEEKFHYVLDALKTDFCARS